jgi:hypothetical protein
MLVKHKEVFVKHKEFFVNVCVFDILTILETFVEQINS